ncbi:MAG: hypothetical protein IJX80_10165 [Clostridia bacterium]|nr:hypothetical protein [Clostridia bacterium]
MEYIKQADYDYIINKYHPDRFARHDEIFSPDSGMDGEEILGGILENDKHFSHLAHPIRKAQAVAYVLKNTRIRCDVRDPFPAINMVDRPLNQTLVPKWEREVFEELIPEVGKRMKQLERDGIVTIWPDYDHSVPVWERVLGLGFSGLLAESEHIRNEKECNEAEDAFFEGIRITYEALIAFVGRLAAQAKKDGNVRLAKALEHIQDNPPATFYEALVLNYIYFMISEHIEGLQVRSLSNFDRIYYTFYENDLKNGVIEVEIRTDLAYFFLQFTAIGNYWNQPVFLGGCRADESTEINALSYLFLDVYDKMGIYNPKIQIKVADSTPKEFLLKALDMVRCGHNCIVFVGDATMRRALMRAGATEEMARLCNVKGCYEYSPQGAMNVGMNYLNMIKPLEYALHEGRDGVTGKPAGLSCPPAESFDTFEKFYAEYKRQFKNLVDITVETVNAFEGYLAYVNPQSMLSATYPTSLERAKDALVGGAVMNDSDIQFGFLANAADSLTMIQKYVYEQKKLTLAALRDILDCNFEGHEEFRRMLSLDREKYGNNQERPDAFAKEIVELAVASTCGRPNNPLRGGKWNCGFHIARMCYTQGATTAATPDGRRCGEELSKNCSSSMGQNREGITAAILSVTKLDATSFTSDACLDAGMLPSAVKGENGLMAMYGLLSTFMQRGGHALQINVFNADILRDAQAHPENYEDLQVRVAGWNVLWNSINRPEQDAFIRQAESLQ